MENEILIAILTKVVEEKFSNLPAVSGHRGPRGPSGPPGRDGKDFVFGEHEETIRGWCRELALAFEDLTPEQIESLRGPRGATGRDGRDFDFSEHEDVIKAWAKDFALKFQDLTPEQIESLRGPRGATGQDGKDGQAGKDFVYDENRERIAECIRRSVGEIKDDLRLRFSDLGPDEINSLRGPRGRDGNDGRNGRDFDFDEHSERLQLSLRKIFDGEKESFKLKFTELTEDEREGLKLRFTDLTEHDKAQIRGGRGARGQRGQAGRDGIDGKTGPQGPRGLPGPQGITGLAGRHGLDGTNGLDGRDAPRIIDIHIEQLDDEFYFVFEFSDGNVIRTDRVRLPEPSNYSMAVVRGKGRMNYETQIDEVDDDTTYIGKALPGSDTDQAKWQIQKISVDGTVTSFEWAGGNAGFVNIWDDRASLEYS